MKAHSCRNSRDGRHDASPLCFLLCDRGRWVFESLRLNMRRLEYGSWVRARRPASGGRALSRSGWWALVERRGKEIQGGGEFQTERARRGGWGVRILLRFFRCRIQLCCVVCACYYSNQHKIFPFQRKSEIVVLVGDDELGIIWAFLRWRKCFTCQKH